MSRSWKKNPGFSDNNKSKKFSKRQANKRVRHKNIANFSYYKKIYNSWLICDYNSRHYSLAETWNYVQHNEDNPINSMKSFYRWVSK